MTTPTTPDIPPTPGPAVPPAQAPPVPAEASDIPVASPATPQPVVPTDEPSAIPAAAPSVIPAAAPSAMPVAAPSAMPAAAPSAMPAVPPSAGGPLPGPPIRLTTPLRQANAVLYQQLLDALNTGDYERLGQLIAPHFVDHRPGFEISGIASYQAAIRADREALRFEAEAEDILQFDDQVVARVRLRGTHLGTVMGIPPTGRPVEWTSIEIWRVSNGRFVECWAQDDLLGLRGRLACDADNLALVRRIADTVNARDFDALDGLFADPFVSHGPAGPAGSAGSAGPVRSAGPAALADPVGLAGASQGARTMGELKADLRAAVAALDLTVRVDDLFAADGGRVVMHATFTGTHTGTVLGREPTGRPLEWTGTEVFQMSGGKVAEHWRQTDIVGLMRQLGIPLPQ